MLETEKQVVVRTDNDGYLTEIKAGPHHFLADEPEICGRHPSGTFSLWLSHCSAGRMHLHDPPHVCGPQKMGPP